MTLLESHVKLKVRFFRRLDWLASGLWVVATLFGSFVGVFVGLVFVAFFYLWSQDWIAYALFGLGFGLVGGIAQSIVLGRWVAQPTGWILATSFGEAISFSGFALASYLDSVNLSLWDAVQIAGITSPILGLAQWLLLRRWVTSAGWWIPAVAGGKVLGMILLLTVVREPYFGFVSILALQVPPALITAATLAVLFRNTERLFAADVSPKPLGL